MANVLQHGSDFDLVNILEQQQETRTTGRLALVAPAPASLYLYRGCVYSAKVEGWDPDIIARVQLAGRLSAEQADHYRAQAPGDHAQQARLAVLDGTVPVEELNTIHLEYLLSAVAALQHYAPSGIVDATVTDIRCAVPVEVAPLRETLRVRAHRSDSTWAAVGLTDPIGRVTFTASGADITPELDMPIVRGVLAVLARPVSADEIAGLTGLSRAEVVHIVAALLQAGLASRASAKPAMPAAGQWWTPEQINEPRK
ncbi:MAG: hypothetical protein VW362_09145 [Candidatus Nanopelagicales bacterium]